MASHNSLLPWLLFVLHLFPLSLSAQRSTYIVHMDKSSKPTAFVSHHHWYSSAVNSLDGGRHSSPPKIVYSYHHALHGFSALLSEEELQALKKSPGFVSAYKDRTFELQTTYTPSFLKLNSNTGLWPASKFGEDVIVGVVDSGVWPESRSFRDDGMPLIPKRWKGVCKEGTEFNSSLCNRKLIGANYFNAGVLAANPGINISMNSARDTNGHGTHTASTAAGNYVDGVSYFGYAPGTAKGVAPRARVAVYKVNWNEGSVTSDLIAGMDQAIADGVDVISVSLGYRHIPLYEDPIAIAAFGAMKKGILVSGSAGNRGPSLGTLNNGAPWILTVASGLTDRWFAGSLTLGNGLKIRGFSVFPGRALVRDVNLLYNKTISSCDSLELVAKVPEPGSTILICEKPEIDEPTFTFSQIQAVASAEIRAAIFINDDPGIFRSTTFPSPGVFISPKEGKQVIKYAKTATDPKATITFQETIFGNKPAPTVAASSSRGPSPSYLGISKPDILAPGVLILAAYPPNSFAVNIGINIQLGTDYNLESGTSMACPHAAGIAAMLKGAHPDWSSSAIRSAMMTTAITVDNIGKPIKDSDDNAVATPLVMGAGLVNPNAALDPGLVYDATSQDYVNLLCAMNFTEAQFQTIARSSATNNCSNSNPDLNYPSFIALYPLGGDNGVYDWTVQTFKRTLTNVGPGAATYKAKLEVPKNSTISVSPTTLVFTKKKEKQSYSLRIRYRGDENQSKNVGSITWVEVNGYHKVRSPIVVSNTVEVWE
ncbi:PREDICTED: subtilisin-like protease SBT1.9 [Ipomoea nil]|uniref:subtilisin-like protease SBT1.9 n=1 Tax=Ipomoea nil TaxID=35883 RepID=UPI00090124BE|nr:PREDICTED: subtilisin-like protease SBT1.9 [Ipomoea nil]